MVHCWSLYHFRFCIPFFFFFFFKQIKACFQLCYIFLHLICVYLIIGFYFFLLLFCLSMQLLHLLPNLLHFHFQIFDSRIYRTFIVQRKLHFFFQMDHILAYLFVYLLTIVLCLLDFRPHFCLLSLYFLSKFSHILL